MSNTVYISRKWVTSKKAIEYLKNQLTTAIENNDREREGVAYGSP